LAIFGQADLSGVSLIAKHRFTGQRGYQMRDAYYFWRLGCTVCAGSCDILPCLRVLYIEAQSGDLQ
jgi:hypothetical protein